MKLIEALRASKKSDNDGHVILSGRCYFLSKEPLTAGSNVIPLMLYDINNGNIIPCGSELWRSVYYTQVDEYTIIF